MKVVEGILGYYFYHLSETGANGKPALCGNKEVMSTEVPITFWGKKSHLNEKWCKKCWDIYTQNK
jgi:hypothetical protein